jgi:hypothetical protein
MVLELAKRNHIGLIVVDDPGDRLGLGSDVAGDITEVTFDIVLHHLHLLGMDRRDAPKKEQTEK